MSKTADSITVRLTAPTQSQARAGTHKHSDNDDKDSEFYETQSPELSSEAGTDDEYKPEEEPSEDDSEMEVDEEAGRPADLEEKTQNVNPRIRFIKKSSGLARSIAPQQNIDERSDEEEEKVESSSQGESDDEYQVEGDVSEEENETEDARKMEKAVDQKGDPRKVKPGIIIIKRPSQHAGFIDPQKDCDETPDEDEEMTQSSSDEETGDIYQPEEELSEEDDETGVEEEPDEVEDKMDEIEEMNVRKGKLPSGLSRTALQHVGLIAPDKNYNETSEGDEEATVSEFVPEDSDDGSDFSQ